MQFGSLVALRNERDGIVVITPDDSNAKAYITFQAKGDPAGGDIQYVPQNTATLPACAKAILSGVLSLDTNSLNSEAAQLFEEHMRIAEMQRKQAEAAAVASIDRAENRDMIGVTCVGPGSRPGVFCGIHLSQRELNNGEVAPLCTMHESLSAQYIRVEDIVFEGDQRKVRNRWVRAQVENRERQEH